MPSSQDADRRELWRLAGLGFTLTSEVVGGALLGWGMDVLFKTSPIFIVTMTLIGVAVAMTGFLRNALGASAQAGRRADAAVHEGRVQPLKDVPGDADGDGEPDPPTDEDRDPDSHAGWKAGLDDASPDGASRRD
ncbi:MAG: AtpZ/AtpI family protein [Phycisphaerales bacterium]